mmetsp:Transcript_16933/g.51369  ORF Transcript_16933/g.51369 Transcript_16933/m.51369 type:complete len:207 (+) Transcript_16933:430-1050(+)
MIVMNPRPSAVRRASAGTAVPSRTGRRRRASRRRSRARATRSCTCGLVGPGFATSFKRSTRASQRRKSDRKQAFQRRESDRKRSSSLRAAAKRVHAHRHQEERRADAHRDRGENRHRRRERHDRGGLDGERSAQAHGHAREGRQPQPQRERRRDRRLASQHPFPVAARADLARREAADHEGGRLVPGVARGAREHREEERECEMPL